MTFTVFYDIPNTTGEQPWSLRSVTRMTGAHSRHVFHLVDARNHKLLPGDKQLLHLLAKAQRRSVRYTIVTGWCTIDIDVDRDLQQFQ